MTAYDPSTGTSSTQTVQHVWRNHDHDLLDVTLHADGQDGHATEASSTDKTQQVATKAHGSQAPPPPSPSDETIHTTEQHPWLTTDRGWVPAGELRVGEQVVELDGRTATITALAVRPGAATYYNLTVSNLHTYAVGDGQYVVHNVCMPNPGDVKAAENTHAALRLGSAGKGVVVAYANIVEASGDVTRVIALNESAWGRQLITEDTVRWSMQQAGESATILNNPDLLTFSKTSKLGAKDAENYIEGYILSHPGSKLDTIGTSWWRGGFCGKCQQVLDLLPHT